MTSFVVGIDPSLSHTALCVIDDGRVTRETLIEPYPNQVKPARLRGLQQGVTAFLLELPAPPRIVAMEGEVWMASAAMGSEQSQAQGALQMALWDLIQGPWRTTRFLSVNAAQLKKYAGAPQKQHVLLQVYKRWGREYRDNNLADAFVIAVIAHDLCAYTTTGRTGGGLWPSATKPQIEVLDKLTQTGFIWEMAAKAPKGKVKAKPAAPPAGRPRRIPMREIPR